MSSFLTSMQPGSMSIFFDVQANQNYVDRLNSHTNRTYVTIFDSCTNRSCLRFWHSYKTGPFLPFLRLRESKPLSFERSRNQIYASLLNSWTKKIYIYLFDSRGKLNPFLFLTLIKWLFFLLWFKSYLRSFFFILLETEPVSKLSDARINQKHAFLLNSCTDRTYVYLFVSRANQTYVYFFTLM